MLNPEHFFLIMKNEIVPSKNTFNNALTRLTRPLSEKILFNPEIGFIFSIFSRLILGKNLFHQL